MSNQISLDLSPEIKHPFTFFKLALAGLCLCAFYLIAGHDLSDRWSGNSIVLVHLFTMGFLFPVFLGAFVQLLPVLFGIKIDFLKRFRPVFYTLILMTGAFAYNFHFQLVDKNILFLITLSAFWVSIVRLIVDVFKSALLLYQEQKKQLYLFLLLALFNLLIGLFFSLWLVLVHVGISLPLFRPVITDNHLSFMILGFFFNLIVAILSNVIPMFFVTSAITPRKLFPLTMLTPLLLLHMFTSELAILSLVIKVLIACLPAYYIAVLFLQLKSRKRKTRDPVIYLWMLFILLGWLTLLAWVFSLNEMILGKLIFSGVFMSLILAMLLKIIPFLIWQHLSQEQMKSMNFNVTLPHMKELFPENTLRALLILHLGQLSALLLDYQLMAGLSLLGLTLVLIAAIINAFKIYQEKRMELSVGLSL